MSDRTALAELYDTTAAKVFGMALQLLRDPTQAEASTVETYERIWRFADAYDGDRASPLSWICAVAHRTATDRLRRRGRRTRPSLGARPEARGGDQEPQVLARAYFGGETDVEIAAALAMPRASVDSLIRKSLTELPPARRSSPMN